MNIYGINEFVARIFMGMIDRYALEYAYDSGDINLINEFTGSVSRANSGSIAHSGNGAGEHLIGPAESASTKQALRQVD